MSDLQIDIDALRARIKELEDAIATARNPIP